MVLQWGLLDKSCVHCDCGAPFQTMSHLLDCPTCPSSCTRADLNIASDAAIAVAKFWSRSRKKYEQVSQQTGERDDCLSCQVDVNKLVQEIGSKRDAVSLEEADPEKTRDVDKKDHIILEIEPEECDKLDDEFMPDATDLGGNDDDNTCDPPPNINEEWVIEKRLCRGCHAEGDFTSLQAMDSIESISYEDMLANCSDIRLCPTEYLSLQALCPLCCTRLRDALAFLRQVRAAETRFQTLYKNNLVKVADATLFEIEIHGELLEESDVADAATFEMETNEKSIEENDGNGLDKDGNSSSHLVERKVMEGKLDPEQKKTTLPKKPQNRLTLPQKILTEGYVQEGDNYKCTKCDKICITLKQFIQHNKRVHLKFWCTLCQKPFETNIQKKIHKQKEHKREVVKRHVCNACDRKFKTAYFLQTHLNVYHMLGEKVKCSSCDFECYSKHGMRRHMVSHKTSRDFACKYCKKTFLRKTTLSFHERIHTGDKQKKCAECGQAFVQKASLNYHMMKHHPEVRF